MPHGVHPGALSSGCSCHPLELNQPADVVAEVHHANLEPRPHDANGAHNLAAHRVLLLAEYDRHGRAPSRASCSPTSGALTADDCERRADGYGSASPSPSCSPRSGSSGTAASVASHLRISLCALSTPRWFL